jgi:uncharacterized hydrophobic protein (TIGR00271 family)
VIHLRIVAPEKVAHHALELLCESPAVMNVVHLHGASHKPPGDVILCDVVREEASVILADLKELEIPRVGSIALEHVDTIISDAAVKAERDAPGAPSDAVVWEEVQQRTSEETELSISFVTFMVLAMQIAVVGILFDQPILIVGAMVVGPEFGPLAGLSVALVHRQHDLARRSLRALAVGFPVGIAFALLSVAIFRWTGLMSNYTPSDDVITGFIAQPDFFSFFIAYVAGTAGMLSLTNAKSGALIGVLISVTTIPAAANIGVAVAYTDWDEATGAAGQLAINLTSIVLAGVITLFIQRSYYVTRRRKHLSDPARSAAGLPIGHSTHPHKKPHARDPLQPR